MLAACGDPRAKFVGTYSGTIVRASSANTLSSAIDTTITAPSDSDRLLFGGACGFTAEVLGDDRIQFDPIACPSYQGTAISGATATYTDSYSGGAGELDARTLTATLSGTEVGQNYSDGSPDATFGFADTWTLTRQ